MNVRCRSLVAAAVTALCLVVSTPGLAENGAVETQAREIFTSVMSPFCPGRVLEDCPSLAAAELKENIRGQLRAGRAPDEIREQLFAKYGDELRAMPAGHGVGLLAWIIPFFFLAAGLVIIVRRSAARTGAAIPAPAAGVQAEGEKLDAEMQRRIDAEIG